MAIGSGGIAGIIQSKIEAGRQQRMQQQAVTTRVKPGETLEELPSADPAGGAGVIEINPSKMEKKYDPQKHAEILESKGYVKDAAALRQTYNAIRNQELDNIMKEQSYRLDSLRAGMQLVDSGAIDEGMEYMNSFLPEGEKVEEITPLGNGKFRVKEQDVKEPQTVNMKDMIRALTDSKTQFIYDQQLAQIRERSKSDELTPSKILANVIQKKIMRDRHKDEYGYNDAELNQKFPELSITDAEQAEYDKHQLGSLVSAISGAVAQNPEMLRIFNTDDPTQFLIDMNKRLIEGFRRELTPSPKDETVTFEEAKAELERRNQERISQGKTPYKLSDTNIKKIQDSMKTAK